MNHKLGVHWIKVHGRPEDLEFIRRLQPLSVKLVAGDVPDVQWISDTFQAAPNTLIVLRSHAMSEQKSDVAADSAFTGRRHAQEWGNHIEKLRNEAKRRKLPFPENDQLCVLGINEPEVWNHLQQTVDYTVAFLDACKRLGMTAGALNLSVGWPANNGPDTPPNWTPYEPVRAALIRGRHYLFLHEYHDLAGPSELWGWWCGRYEKCPWPDVKIIIGEYGIDRYVKDGNIDHDVDWNADEVKSRRGWQGWLTKERLNYETKQSDNSPNGSRRACRRRQPASGKRSRHQNPPTGSDDCTAIHPDAGREIWPRIPGTGALPPSRRWPLCAGGKCGPMSEGERVAHLVQENRFIAARVNELTGWLADGLTPGADNAVVAGLLRQLTDHIAANRRTIRNLLWQERLEKARLP